MKLMRLIPEGTSINFVGMRFPAFIFSTLLVIGSIVSLFVNGLNFGIDFTGGTAIEIRTESPADVGALRAEFQRLNFRDVNVQTFGSENDVLIRLGLQGESDKAQSEATDRARQAITNLYDGKVEIRQVESVGPQVGDELKKQGMWAVTLALGAIMFYVWLRFEWQYGVAAIVALAHDVISTLGFFSVTGIEFNLATVAAVLTVAGYSINDTVIVFDRVRENLRRYKSKEIPDVLNGAMNQTLSRTIVTSFTTLIALFALSIFGGSVIQSFTIALIWGVVIGTYSSILVAVPSLINLNLKRSTIEDVQKTADATE